MKQPMELVRSPALEETGEDEALETHIGEPLERVLRGGDPLGPVEALLVARQLADALRCAHEKGVIHGALAPARVHVYRGLPVRALLSGFATDAHPVLGYSAPEQLAGKDADARTDVFALGLLIFELLEGRPFFSGEETEIRNALLESTAPLLPRFTRIPPAGVPELVARAIRRAPAERPPTMECMRDEIDACLGRLSRTGVGGTPRSRRTRIAGAAIVVVAGLALLLAAPRGIPTARHGVTVVPEDGGGASPAPRPAVEMPAPAGGKSSADSPVAMHGRSRESRPAPTRTLSYQPPPGRPITITAGGPVDFAVRGAARGVDDGLGYAWFLDGKPVGRGRSWRFVAPPAASATRYTIELRAADAGDRSAPRVTWRLEVAPRMSRTNVHEWLERFAAAWQRRDLATLELYGIAPTEAARNEWKRQLPRRDDHRIVIANEKIRTDRKYATVAFDLVELDERGRIVSSRTDSFALEKRADGFVALRRR